MKYRAFISYSSKDRVIGERFHRALERYKVPKALRGRVTSAGAVPTRMAPIFRDRSDLEASADLGLRIRSGLENSQWLVVLCSPASAASRWVNQEIVTFKRLGRANQIIPVLVSGEAIEYDPKSAPNGSFPPALMREVYEELNGERRLPDNCVPEPFAPDLREMRRDGFGGDGFELAKLKVIARMIDVPLVELTQRQAEVERRERRIITAVAVAMLFLTLVATAGGWIAWNKNLQAQARLGKAIDMAARQVDAAASYRDRYGVPARVLQELLDSAQRDFSDLINDAGETPQIQLQRARLALRFADLYQIVGDFIGRAKMLATANADLEALETATDKVTLTIKTIVQKFGLVATAEREMIARERLRYWRERAVDAVLVKQFPEAFKAATNATELAQRWVKADASNTTWEHELAKTHLLAADIHYRAGNLSASKAVYQRTIPEFLALRDGTSRADLLTAYSNLATAVVELDERHEAFGYQERAVAIARETLAADSDKTDAKRTLAVALTRLGDMALAANMNPEDALKSYLEARVVFEDLVGVDPLRVDWHRDRYVFLERISSVYLQLGKLEAANADLADAIRTVERLLRIDPKNSDWRRDETVFYERLGQIRLAQSQQAMHANTQQQYLSEAVAALERSVAGRKELFQQTPEDVVAKHDLAMALLLLGTAQSFLSKQLPTALESFDRALAIMAELAARPDAPPNWHREIADIHVRRGKGYERAGRFSEARSEFNAALAIIRRLGKELPNVRQYKADEIDLVRLLTGSMP